MVTYIEQEANRGKVVRILGALVDQVKLGGKLVAVYLMLGASPVKVHLQQLVPDILGRHHKRERQVIHWRD